MTVYDGINFGSYLQAFAMQRLLNEMGHEVFFIQHMTPEDNLKLFTVGRCEEGKIIHRAKRKIKTLIVNLKNKKRKEYFINEYAYFIEAWKRFKTIRIDELDKIDLIVCGSDEIWNFNNPVIDVPFYSCTSFACMRPKIAIAISLGDSSLKDFLSNQAVIQSIKSFKCLLPRDDNTKKILESITNRELNIIIDPTLLVDKSIFIKGRRIIDEKYIFVYAYNLTENEESVLKNYARNNNLKIITAANYLKIADETLLVDPLAFANLILNAECCYTSTFHGTIFCLLFAKRFCCNAKTMKINDLLKQTDCIKYKWDGDASSFNAIVNDLVNHDLIDKQIVELRTIGLNKIEHCLDDTEQGK